MDARGRTRRTRTLVGAVAAAAALLGTVAAPPGSAGPGTVTAGSVGTAATDGFFAKFNFDDQSFQSLEGGDPFFWEASGGSPGGYIAVQRGAGGVAGVRTPTEWSGDRAGLLGGRLSFEIRLSAGASSAIDVVLRSTEYPEVPDIYRRLNTDSETIPDWTAFQFALSPKRGWRVGDTGEGARRDDFEAVLSTFDYASVAATPAGSNQALNVDNVKLSSQVEVGLSLGYRGGRFFGRVTPAGGCAVDRPVTVFRQRPGPDTRIGSTSTDRRGEWAVAKRGAAEGVYYARVPGGFVQGGGDCSAARASLTLD